MSIQDYGAIGHRCDRCKEIRPLYDFHGTTLCPKCCRVILTMFKNFLQHAGVFEEVESNEDDM